MAYSKGTKVSIGTSEEQIKTALRKAGAETVGIMEEPGFAYVAFHLNGRSIRFKLPLPSRREERFTLRKANQFGTLTANSESTRDNLWTQATRERYRQLLLCIKAKLVSVEEGIESFDDAFLSQIVVDGGETVGDHLRPQIASQYGRGDFRPALMPPGK